MTNLSTTLSGKNTHNLSLSCNSNGNRTGQNDSVTGTSTTFGYDQANRMTSYSQGSTTASYVYNGDGLRTGKTVNGVATAEVWDTVGSIPVLIQDGSTNYIVGPTGLPLEQISGTTVTWYYQDQLGSTRELLDGTATIVGTYTYTAYGTVATHTGSVTTPFGYAGQYTDAESGLQYLRARYYDPATQQFLTVDPLVGLTGQPYGYVGSGPLNAVDPTGLCGAGPFSLPFGGGGTCSSDIGAAADNAASSALNATAEPTYSGANDQNQTCLEQSASQSGAGSALPAIGAASDALMVVSIVDPEVLAEDGGYLLLTKGLASDAQVGEEGTVIAGEGSTQVFRDAPYYGGRSEDWVKKAAPHLGRGMEPSSRPTGWRISLPASERRSRQNSRDGRTLHRGRRRLSVCASVA